MIDDEYGAKGGYLKGPHFSPFIPHYSHNLNQDGVPAIATFCSATPDLSPAHPLAQRNQRSPHEPFLSLFHFRRLPDTADRHANVSFLLTE